MASTFARLDSLRSMHIELHSLASHRSQSVPWRTPYASTQRSAAAKSVELPLRRVQVEVSRGHFWQPSSRSGSSKLRTYTLDSGNRRLTPQTLLVALEGCPSSTLFATNRSVTLGKARPVLF